MTPVREGGAVRQAALEIAQNLDSRRRSFTNARTDPTPKAEHAVEAPPTFTPVQWEFLKLRPGYYRVFQQFDAWEASANHVSFRLRKATVCI